MGVNHPTQLIVVFLEKIVGQAGPEFLSSRDPLALASQSAGITGMSHYSPARSHFYSHLQGDIFYAKKMDLGRLLRIVLSYF